MSCVNIHTVHTCYKVYCIIMCTFIKLMLVDLKYLYTQNKTKQYCKDYYFCLFDLYYKMYDMYLQRIKKKNKKN